MINRTQEDLNALPDAEFRMRFLRWLEQHCPDDVRRPAHRLRGPRAREAVGVKLFGSTQVLKHR